MALEGNVRIILVGGSSHVGKSTAAGVLARRLGWGLVATDYLARHPGRPWKMAPAVVPGHVAEHYLGLGVEELMVDVLRHYRVNVWPMVEGIVRAGERMVVEGSAVWPEFVAGLKGSGVAGVWLTVSAEMFGRRIFAESGYEGKSGRQREMIEKFLARTVRYNEMMMEAVGRLGLASMRVEEGMGAEEVADACVAGMRGVG